MICVLIFLFSGCTPAGGISNKEVTVSINVDNSLQTLEVPIGSTVLMAIEKAGINLGSLDQVNPPSYTVITTPIEINIKRVSESFETEESIIPYERQTVKNESLPEGQELLIQPGINGLQQITYRRLFEDGKEVSRTIIQSEIITEPKPEIIMVGVKMPFTSVPINGALVYLSAGNAWIIEDNTSNRRPLVTSGDLDGRIFKLSPDRRWLLFTRKSDKDPAERINTLWAVDVQKEKPEMVYLRATDIVHFADWIPDTNWMVAYSTVEPRSTPPGWQANNDLYRVAFNEEGTVLQISETIPANSGGIYGWWGTDFAWSPDGKRLAYARPDSVGLVNLADGNIVPLLNVLPLQTRSDWAWVPGINWSADHRVLYATNHSTNSGSTSDETSPFFDLVAIVPEADLNITLVPQSGMFAYPVPYPYESGKWNLTAYLQAVFPEQSETSRYRLVVMDRDGSNREVVFPEEGKAGLDPQKIVWEPEAQNDIYGIGVIYEGNLWILHPQSDSYQQITGDGSISRIDWK